MKQTERYELNQWELSDPVRMEDFNADNAKIAAALAGISTTLGGKLEKMEVNRFKQFDSTLSSFHASFILDDWDEWSCLFVFLNPNVSSPGNDDYIEISLKENDPSPFKIPPKPALYILFPMYDGSQEARGVLLAENIVHVFAEPIPYNQIMHANVRCFPLNASKMDQPYIWFFGLK